MGTLLYPLSFSPEPVYTGYYSSHFVCPFPTSFAATQSHWRARETSIHQPSLQLVVAALAVSVVGLHVGLVFEVVAGLPKGCGTGRAVDVEVSVGESCGLDFGGERGRVVEKTERECPLTCRTSCL